MAWSKFKTKSNDAIAPASTCSARTTIGSLPGATVAQPGAKMRHAAIAMAAANGVRIFLFIDLGSGYFAGTGVAQGRSVCGGHTVGVTGVGVEEQAARNAAVRANPIRSLIFVILFLVWVYFFARSAFNSIARFWANARKSRAGPVNPSAREALEMVNVASESWLFRLATVGAGLLNADVPAAAVGTGAKAVGTGTMGGLVAPG